MSLKKSNNYASARKNELAINSTLSELPCTPHSGVHDTEAPNKLKPQFPDPEKGFMPLSPLLVHTLSKVVLKYMQQLVASRGADVDLSYWQKTTVEILGITERDRALVIPARAGAGKSTWITAFLLALCDLYLVNDPFVFSLGGIMLVIQKVETLNDILDTIEEYFPGHAESFMVALQGWSRSGQEHGFCSNKHVSGYHECGKQNCPWASGCKVLSFQDRASSGFCLGMTQRRFSMLRDSGGLDHFLFRAIDGQERSVPRRFIVFDEKFDMARQEGLTVDQIYRALDSIERTAKRLRLPDSEARLIQDVSVHRILTPFQALRKSCEGDGKWTRPDIPFGFCQLTDETVCNNLLQFHTIFFGRRIQLFTPELKDCVNAMIAFAKEPCLFVKQGGFKVIVGHPREITFASAQSIIFDATAEVDGDYLYLDDARFLPSSPALHMRQVTFHVFTHPDLNVSKSAMQKPWKLPAFQSLIEILLTQLKGDTFLCTYKDFAGAFADGLSDEAIERIPMLTTKEPPCIPYFGGANGANNFNHCSNVIMVGYPRFAPIDYLQHTYAAWGPYGFRDEILTATEHFNIDEIDRKNVFCDLPMLTRYQHMHLSARIEQETYRCALRNYKCTAKIQVCLFCPSEGLLELLLSRFDGCSVKYYNTLPDCVAFQRDSSRTYGGNPTTYSKLASFLTKWNGKPIKSCDLREQLDISDSAWKDLMKSDRTKQLLKDYDVTRTGRGPNTTLQRQEKLCA